MEIKHEIKCEITDEEKLGIYIYAYHRKFMLAVVLLLLAGVAGVAVTWFCGWKFGMAAFMLVYVVSFMLADGLFTAFMTRAIDKVVKQKIAEQ